MVHLATGDVLARFDVRAQEAKASLQLLATTLDGLPERPVRVPLGASPAGLMKQAFVTGLFALSLTSTSAAGTVPAAMSYFQGATTFEKPTGPIAAAASGWPSWSLAPKPAHRTRPLSSRKQVWLVPTATCRSASDISLAAFKLQPAITRKVAFRL